MAVRAVSLAAAPARALFATPRRPYTRALLAAIPHPDPSRRGRVQPPAGDVPNPANPPPGCRFHTRCPHVASICREQPPPTVERAPGHAAACHCAAALPPMVMDTDRGVSANAARRLALFAGGTPPGLSRTAAAVPARA